MSLPLLDTLASIARIALRSRCGVAVPTVPPGSSIVVMGNGPSLADTIEHHADFLADKALMAVNFAASTPQFRQLRPRYYVLADPLFFSPTPPENIQRLWQNLSDTDWPMTLFVPTGCSTPRLSASACVSIARFNMVAAEGFGWLERWAYGSGAAMPRPRNVLIPSIMQALRMGYDNIYLAGADHSWTKTLWVDDANHVVSVQPHFYADSDAEKQRIATDYVRYPLHHIIYSFYLAFRAYHKIEHFAKPRGQRIVNITPDSFIDAFERKRL